MVLPWTYSTLSDGNSPLVSGTATAAEEVATMISPKSCKFNAAEFILETLHNG